MDIAIITELITTLGFPIAICVALFWFIYKIYKASEAREAELRQEIKENQAINAKAIETISLYAERLDIIQKDVSEIKNDIIVLTDRAS